MIAPRILVNAAGPRRNADHLHFARSLFAQSTGAVQTIKNQTVAGRDFNDLSEIGDSFGVGVKGRISSKLKVGGDLESFRSVNKYQQNVTVLDGGIQYQTNAAGTVGVVPTPNITNKMLRLKLFAQYPIQKNADLRFNLIYERWRTDDWSWTMFPATGATPWAYSSATDGTRVTAKPKQTSTFAGVRYIYRFE